MVLFQRRRRVDLARKRPSRWLTGVALGLLGFHGSNASAASPTQTGDRPHEVDDQDTPTHAQELGDAIGFDEAIGLSANTPGLVGLQEALRNKRSADDDLPGLSQNPVLQVMPGARLPGADEPGFELQATLTQGWRLGGYGSKRERAAHAQSDALAAEVRAAQLAASLGAARAWVDLHAAEQALTEAVAALETDRSLVTFLERARSAGAATTMQVAQARNTAAQAQLTVAQLRGAVHDLGLQLALEVGSTEMLPMQTQGAYPSAPSFSEAELQAAFARLASLPTVVRRRLDARAASAHAVEARASQSTLLGTGVSVQYESNGDTVLFGVLSVQIPVFERSQREVAAAQFEAGRAEADAQQLAVQAAARLRVAMHDLHHTEARVQTLRDETLPAIDAELAALTRALEMGQGTRAETLQAQHLRHVVARELIAAEAQQVWARVEVWLYLQAIAGGDEAGPDALATKGAR